MGQCQCLADDPTFEARVRMDNSKLPEIVAIPGVDAIERRPPVLLGAGRPEAKDSSDRDPFLYPMYVLPIKEFMELREVLPHGELLALGKLITYDLDDKTRVVLFVSHQWCSTKHPDPHFKQLPVLQNALRNLFDGSITVATDYSAKVFTGASNNLSSGEVKELKQSDVWYDYFAIPQLRARNVAVTQQMTNDTQKAVDSIPAYVTHAKYFFVLAPLVNHAESGELLQLATWSARGWCRLERAGRVLAPNDTRIILVTSEQQLKFVGAQDYLQDPPGKGSFAYEDDRVKVAHVMRGMFAAKLDVCKRNGDLHHYRVLLSIRRLLEYGLPKGELTNYDASSFHATLKLGSPIASDEYGWTPLHYAAVAADIPAMTYLLEQKADLHSGTTNMDVDYFVVPQTMPIALATRFGTREAVEFLLDKGAKLNESAMAYGVSLVIHAAWAGNLDTLLTLMDRKADINSKTAVSITPLDSAAMNNHVEVAARLLSARAAVTASVEGKCPLFMAALNSVAAPLVRCLIAGRCDVNGQLRCHEQSAWFPHMFDAGAEAYASGERSEFALVGRHANGMTPLMAAVLTGKRDVAEALISAGAGKDVRTNDGQNLVDLATSLKLPGEFVSLLTERQEFLDVLLL